MRGWDSVTSSQFYYVAALGSTVIQFHVLVANYWYGVDTSLDGHISRIVSKHVQIILTVNNSSKALTGRGNLRDTN